MKCRFSHPHFTDDESRTQEVRYLSTLLLIDGVAILALARRPAPSFLSTACPLMWFAAIQLLYTTPPAITIPEKAFEAPQRAIGTTDLSLSRILCLAKSSAWGKNLSPLFDQPTSSNSTLQLAKNRYYGEIFIRYLGKLLTKGLVEETKIAHLRTN